jgi:predicted helicase
LIEDYKQVDGKPLGERNPKWLQDDYVKFIRWGQWRINRTGRGILAMITNHGYLDNPTFRGMRQQLLSDFNEIYLLNLHGNAKKKEVCPDGSRDENVFDIQQGVAIGIFAKTPGRPAPARVHYADLWGLRERKRKGEPEGKYEALAQLELGTMPWRELQPVPPFYLFVPQAVDLRAEYDRGWSIKDIMPFNGVGLTTARDKIVIDFNEEPILERARLFRDSQESNKELCDKLGIPMKKGWNIDRARNLIRNEKNLKEFILPIEYRPFDIRLILYHDSLVWRTVKQIMRHMTIENNVGLLWTRPMSPTYDFSVFISRLIIDQCVVGDKSAGGGVSYIAPLYLYPLGNNIKSGGNQNSILVLCEPSTPYGRKANINCRFLESIEQKLKLTYIPDGRGDIESTFGPEDVFSYAYAVFHSPTYRQRYGGFLKGDFPRLPLTGNKSLFKALVGLGADLVSLHLLESPALDQLITRFPVAGSQVVERVHYDEKNQRVYINSDQYFEGVPPGRLGFPGGRLPGLAQVAERPQGPPAIL